MHIFADQISQITLSNNNIRVTLTQKGSDDSLVEAGTLIIPVNQANNFVNRMANGLMQIDKQIKAGEEGENKETQ
jgi:hypothetical protein